MTYRMTWNSVDEKLPQLGENIFVCTFSKVGTAGLSIYQGIYKKDTSGEPYFFINDDCYDARYESITHWIDYKDCLNSLRYPIWEPIKE